MKRGILVVTLLTLLSLVVGWTVPTPSLYSAVLARGYAHGHALGVTTHFRPTDNPLHCVVDLRAIPTTTTLHVIWIARRAGGVQNYTIAQKTFTVTAGDAVVNATLWLPRPWPVGTYQVRVVAQGRTLRTLPFLIR